MDFDESDKMVVLASGGPLMEVESIEERPDGSQLALCRWENWGEYLGNGTFTGKKICRGVFNVNTLRQLVPFEPEFWQGDL